MRGKLNEIRSSIILSGFDVIVLTETNLSDDVNDAEICPGNYAIFRCDRSPLTSSKSSKGGVLVAIRENIASSRLTSSVDDVEHLLVKIEPCKGTTWLLVGCYIPPQQHVSKYNSFLSSVEEAMSMGPKFDDVLIIGDFNIPGVNWDDPLIRGHSPASGVVLSLMELFDLQQINRVYNRRDILLDLVLSSNKSFVVSLEKDFLLPVEERHHPPLSISLPCNILTKQANSKQYIHDLKRCNLQDIHRSLSAISFASILNTPNLNESTENFLSTIAGIVRLNSPLRRVGVSPFPRWFSSDLKNLVITKKVLHKEYKRHPTSYNYLRFSCVRASCKNLAGRDYRLYMEKIERGIPGNLRYFWSHVNSLKKTSTIPSSLVYNGSIATRPGDMCELFKDFFSSVFTKPTEVFKADCYNHLGDSPTMKFSPQEILKKLAELDETKGWGPDGVPPKVLKYCGSLLAAPICHIFNTSMATGVFPDSLKLAYVVPIHKSGPADDVCNYRPISILSALSKVFEDLFLDRIKHKVAGIVCPQQHGFTNGRSTVSNLIILQTQIQEAFVSNKQLDTIYLDFSKAFDTVDHTLLLNKIQNQGFGNNSVRWLSSYLSNRRLCVRFASSLSSEFISYSGVPQGSLLGPYLFSLFINDLPEVLRNGSLLFADDVKIFSIISAEDDCLRIQRDLSDLERWCTINRMNLNTKKCQVITFHRCQSPIIFNYRVRNELIARVQQVKDLGIIMTPSLNNDAHISNICSRANRMLGFVFRFSRQLNDITTLKFLYCALVRQILEYGSPVWSPNQKYLIEKLERAQRRFVRMVGVKEGFPYHLVPIDDLSRVLGLQSLEERRLSADIVLLHKIVNGKMDCPDLLSLVQLRTPSSTRSNDLFIRQHHRTNYAANSTMARLQMVGNNVAAELDFFVDSVATVKMKIKGYNMFNH